MGTDTDKHTRHSTHLRLRENATTVSFGPSIISHRMIRENKSLSAWDGKKQSRK
jgi:hypothetical protein